MITNLYSPLSSIAAGMEVLFTDEDYFEVLVWGIVFVFVIIGLFILNRVLRITYGSKVRSQGLDFGMKTQDLDKMKSEGQISEEEYKKIKKAMAKQYMNIAMSEERKTKLPDNAEVALEVAGQQVEESPEDLYPREEDVSDQSDQPSAGGFETQAAQNDFPEHLRPLLTKSDYELQEMKQAGFLTDQDLVLIKEQRLMDDL